MMIQLIACSLTYWFKSETANNKSSKNTQKKTQRKKERENKIWEDQEIEVNLISKLAA